MKKSTRKTLLKVMIMAVVWYSIMGATSIIDLAASRPGAEAAVTALNGGDYEADALQATSRIPSMVYPVSLIVLTALTLLVFKKEISKTMKKIKFSSIAILLVAASALFMTGCRKKYNKPEYLTIAPNETVFMIQAEGDSTKQDQFKSPEMLAKNMVAAKRILIPKRWNQTGRPGWHGDWIPSVMFLKVNRTPVTRVWDADPNKGTSRANQALVAESKDSLFVSTGFTLTAYIEPAGAAKGRAV